MRRALPFLGALGVAVFLLLRPLYIVHLRHELRREDPAAWAKLPTNGSFRFLFPEMPNRYHDELFYASCAREVLLHGRPYDPFLPDARGLGAWIQNCIPSYIMAGVAALCGGNLNFAWLVAVALLGAGWFYLFYVVFLFFGGKAEVAFPLALFSILFPDVYMWLLDVNFHLRDNLERWPHAFFQQHATLRPHFYRIPSGFLDLFLECLLFVGAWKLCLRKEKSPAFALLLGLGFGLTAWVHPFELAFSLSTTTALAGACWLWPEGRVRSWNATLAAAVSIVVGFSCVALAHHAVEPQAWADHLSLLGVTHSRRPYPVSAVHLAVAALGWALMRGEKEPARRAGWLVLAATQVGIFICRNSQVLFGFTVQPFHYIPIGSTLGCALLFSWLARELSARRWWKRGAGALASVVILFWALGNEKASAEATYKMYGMPQAEQAALDWAKANIPKDSYLLSLSVMTNAAIPLYTDAKVLAPPLILTTAPFTLDSYFLKVARLLKTSRADVERFLAERWPLPSAAAPSIEPGGLEAEFFSPDAARRREASEWFFSWGPDFHDDAAVLRMQEKLKRLAAETSPLPGPFYLWVNAGDVHLMKRDPRAFGGTLAYSNESVSIYYFR